MPIILSSARKVFILITLLATFCGGGGVFANASPTSVIDLLIEKSRQMRLAQHPQWIRLGFYEKKIFGGYQSRNSEAFFLAEDGASNPEHELEMSIRALFSEKERKYPALYPSAEVKTESQIPQCQFPVRTRWLKQMLGIDEQVLPRVQCDALGRFRARMRSKSAAIVFSSFYMNNPGSAFGHTLLRMSRNESSQSGSDRLELLDFGFGYAAEGADSGNQVIYSLKGLFGLSRGTYTNMPYFYKVREYNNFESRDLWSYELNLTQEEVSALVDRIWEMGPVAQPYSFFTFNCGNAILNAIEVAAPRYDLVHGLKYYVIPSDVVKHLMSIPGLVRNVSYRPSAYSLFTHRFEMLNEQSREALRSVIKSSFEVPKDLKLSQIDQIQVLDTAVDYLDYKYAKSMEKEGSEPLKWRQRLLLSRAEIPMMSASVAHYTPEDERPEVGHPSSRVSVQLGKEQSMGVYSQAQVRFALHDYLDPPRGYPKFSQVEMMGTQVRYYADQKKVEVEDLNLVRLMNISPVTDLGRDLSWKAELGGRRIRDENCSRCFASVLEVGVGYSVKLLSESILYSFAEFSPAYSPSFFSSKGRLGVGPALGIIWNTDKWGFHLGGKYQYQAFTLRPHTYELTSEFRYHPDQKLMFGVIGKVYTTTWDMGLNLHLFF